MGAASDHRNVIEMEREEGKGEPVDYDKVLDHLGQFGAFQKRIFFWLSFVSAAAGLAVVAFAFTGYEPNYEVPAPAPSNQPAAPAPVQNSEPSYSSPEPEYKLVIVPQPAYAAPAASYPAPAVNQHPHTFFHESQAQKVHDGGEWPTVYYNTFEGTKKTLIL